jgi:hypothetical protein
VLAGCGGDAGERAAPTATPTATPTPTPTAFAPSAPEPPEDAPEAQPGGAGDEEPAVTRLALVVGRGGVTPSEVEAPAFLAIEITVRNETPDEQLVVVARDQGTVTVAAGRTGRVRLAGLRPGRYRITARNTGAATLVVKRSTP